MGGREIRAGVPFVLHGFWWDSSKPEADPAFGHLKYEPDAGIDLELFEWQGMLSSAAESSAPVLFGQSLDGVPCTVFDALEVNRQSHLPGAHSKGEWRSSVMAHGAWIEDRSRVPVHKLVVTWRGLAEWISSKWRVSGEGGRAISPESDPLAIDLRDGTRLTVAFDRWQRNGEFHEDAELVASVTVEPVDPSALGELEARYVSPIKSLVLFCTEEQTVTESLTLFGLDGDDSSLVAEARHSVEIVGQDASRPLVVKHNPFNHLLMPFAAWPADPAALFQRWLDLHGKLGSAADLLFATLNNPPPYIENRFLNLMTFAEAYHRTLHDTPPLTLDEHKAATEQMLESLSAPLRSHYGPRLQYAYEQGLRSRIKFLFRRAESAVQHVKDWRSAGLPDSLVVTRNALIHRAGEEGETLEGGSLFWATRRLLVVLQVNLLFDLEMPLDNISACIAQRHRTSKNLFDPI